MQMMNLRKRLVCNIIRFFFIFLCGGKKCLARFDNSKILGIIRIKQSISFKWDKLQRKFYHQLQGMIYDIFQCLFHKKYQNFLITFHWYQLIDIFYSFHSLIYQLEQVTFLSLINVVTHFHILGKKLPSIKFNYYLKQCPQNYFSHTLRFFHNF